ncbi:hypothetical protein [Orrella sp. 11846]|uniref:hypothetical protein n=1 Tax=Orrella sp. 11846 TaxID=3409913 RepID=UPI003B5B731E
MHSAVQHVAKPWYKEPWPWLLMLGPALAVVGCAITIKLALDNFSDEPIYDGGVKRGLKVERDTGYKPGLAQPPKKSSVGEVR